MQPVTFVKGMDVGIEVHKDFQSNLKRVDEADVEGDPMLEELLEVAASEIAAAEARADAAEARADAADKALAKAAKAVKAAKGE